MIFQAVLKRVPYSTNLKSVPRSLVESSRNPFPNKPWFLRVCRRSFLKTLWEKEKLLVTSNFSFSHSVFYPFRELFAIFIKFEIVVCKVLVWKSLKFVVWERVNTHKICHSNKFQTWSDCAQSDQG